MRRLYFICALLIAIFAWQGGAATAQAKFFLQPHDRVLFYGDSITEQRLYTNDISAFVHTRFPKLPVTFINAGVGGDTVRGGWAGPLSVRLKRDVYPHHPTVIVLMLGMNDVFAPHPMQPFEQGYRRLLERLRRRLPRVRLVLVQPSPFGNDGLPNKINNRLIAMGQFVKSLAGEYGAMCVNFNKPLVQAAATLNKLNPALARQLIPGKVHPGASGQLIMAESLLKAWHAPAVVTDVRLDVSRPAKTKAINTRVLNLKIAAGVISWVQRDDALPFPVMNLHARWPQFVPMSRSWTLNAIRIEYPYSGAEQLPNYTNPLAAQVVKITHLYSRFDRQVLAVSGLGAARYKLDINGEVVGIFSRKRLAAGVNLAKFNTPMLMQAQKVFRQVWRVSSMRYFAWRQLQLSLEASTPEQSQTYSGSPFVHVKPARIDNSPQAQQAVRQILAGYSVLVHLQSDKLSAMAVPGTTEYELTPVTAASLEK